MGSTCGALGGWEATPHQRFERLLRETDVGAGLIIADRELRVVCAPKGETSGWLSFPITDLATVAGRPLLGGLKAATRSNAALHGPAGSSPAGLASPEPVGASFRIDRACRAGAWRPPRAAARLRRGRHRADPRACGEPAPSSLRGLADGAAAPRLRALCRGPGTFAVFERGACEGRLREKLLSARSLHQAG